MKKQADDHQMQTFPWWDLYETKIAWGSRSEGVEDCATRLARYYLARLKPLHPGMVGLYSTVGGVQQPLYPLPAQSKDYEPLFKKLYTAAKKGEPPSVNGFKLQANGEFGNDRSLVLNIVAGTAGDDVDTAKAPAQINSLSLSTVVQQVRGEDASIIAKLKAILLAAVDAWEPDCGGLFSHNYSQLSHNRAKPGPFSAGSWSIYLAPHLTERVLPPEDSLIEPVIGGGLLVQATEGPFFHTDRKQREAAEHIHAAVLPVGL